MDLPLDAGMQRALHEFLDYCRLERRLAPLTCSAYERDVRAS
jgi:site-specific recombinase XerC